MIWWKLHWKKQKNNGKKNSLPQKSVPLRLKVRLPTFIERTVARLPLLPYVFFWMGRFLSTIVNFNWNEFQSFHQSF